MDDITYLKKYYQGDLKEAISRLHSGQPVQYIVGNVDFYGNYIKVNENVLIPRFETEELVFKTYNYINKYFDKDVSIIDLGTGSGCIAITLKKLLPKARLEAIDISNEALNLAKENAEINKANINFYISNMLGSVNGAFDIIISNPPYIDYDEKIMDIVKNNEPSHALFASDKGLYFYKQILKKAHLNINKKALIAMEIGYKQGEDITKIAHKYFPQTMIRVEKDMQGRERFIFIFIGLSRI
ncbi:MAG: peptide chain release factor N(5)-glutamine methyltransferase [Bacilli bacterium]|nr:peptide chain release factor N(5)-glutamine methyltransferase [Bacilli bacterium]